MRNFLLRVREATEVKTLLNINPQPKLGEIVKKAEKEKDEAGRRKNVAEFKYWGFAIELIETVRREFKEFRKFQEELLKNIKELRDEINSIKTSRNEQK